MKLYFSWSFSSEGISGTVEKATENFTTLEGYFVDPSQEYKPQSQLEIASEYDKKFDELYVKLHSNLDIILDATRGFTGMAYSSICKRRGILLVKL